MLYILNGAIRMPQAKRTTRFKDEDFVKSSWSKNNPKTCVTVAQDSEGVAIRDSKDPDSPTLEFNNDEWWAFIKGVHSGQFNPVGK